MRCGFSFSTSCSTVRMVSPSSRSAEYTTVCFWLGLRLNSGGTSSKILIAVQMSQPCDLATATSSFFDSERVM